MVIKIMFFLPFFIWLSLHLPAFSPSNFNSDRSFSPLVLQHSHFKTPADLVFYTFYFNMIKLFLFSFLIINAFCNCPANHHIQGFFTGHANLYPTTSNNLYIHNFKATFAKSPSLAIGVADLGYDKQQFNAFYVQVTSVSPSRAQFSLKPGSGRSWRQIKIVYWATDRSDMVLGTAHVVIGQLKGKSITKFIKTVPIPNHALSIVRPFLNGFTLNPGASSIDLHLEGREIQSNQISVEFIAGAQTNVKEVWISYVIFSPSSLPFASYGGQAAEVNFRGDTHNNIRTIIHYTKNVLSGLSKIKANLSQSFSFHSEVDQNLVLSYSNEGNPIDLFLNYLVLGNPPNSLCSKCPGKFSLDDQCLQTCPLDSYAYTYRDKGKGCKRCSTKFGEVLNSERTGCVKGSPKQSFTPNIQSISSPPIVKKPYKSQSCAEKEFSYWTGYRCACRVGFRENNQTGACEKIIVDFPKKKQAPKCSKTQYYNGITCLCLPKHKKNSAGQCVIDLPTVCPKYSTYVNGQCKCIKGYEKVGPACLPKNNCSSHMVPDGKGGCKCKDGFYYDTKLGKCVHGKPCPPNSIRDAYGKCECYSGFYRNSAGKCVNCENGKFWDGYKCIHLCGINQIYSQKTSKCECKKGYGYLEGICQQCSGHYFLKDGYCVSCPLNSHYDQYKDTCVCEDGYALIDGLCQQKCGAKQIFSEAHGKCKCYTGLGRVGGICQVCPGGTSPNPVTQICSGCGSNQIQNGGQCKCKPGFGLLKNGGCIKCEDQGMFLLNGICASCPPGKKWDGQNCACPAGFNEVGSGCQKKCDSNQLIDSNGYCYYCPINERPVNNKCECKDGYTRHPSLRICLIDCKPNQFLLNGLCASCSLNSVYDENLNSCVCPEHHYKNNYGYCQLVELPPITCDKGSYYLKKQGCKPCPDGCKQCINQHSCKVCSVPGFSFDGYSCKPECGDGKIVRGLEECDDKNKNSGDGCSSTCRVQDKYICNSEPSVCTSIAPPSNCGDGVLDAGETCDDGNKDNGDGCSNTCQQQSGYKCEGVPSTCSRGPKNMQQVGNTINNSAAVYMTIKTSKVFKFKDENEMKNFLKSQFSNGKNPNSAFCNQRFGAPQLFDCVFLYPSGVPLTEFSIRLYFSKDGVDGQLSVKVDASGGAFSTRSLN